MSWGKEHITKQAHVLAYEDYAAFEALGLASRDKVRVLDVGCFDGLGTVLKFAPYPNIIQVVGIDPVADAVAEASQRTDDPRFSFRCVSFEDFDPNNEEQFDIVCFSHVLQHLSDPEAALAHAWRLLAPGGFVVVRTIDDALKMSYPDPENVMRRLFSLYEQHVLRATSWTTSTDRYQGEKCYTLLKQAGFANVCVRAFLHDTTEKTKEERLSLFERCVYFRRNVPPSVDTGVADEIRELISAWEVLFERDDYYFATQSFVALAQKPSAELEVWAYEGPLFENTGTTQDYAAACPVPARGECGLCVRRMTESDLGSVMAIEIASFKDPWTPLAFALDMRHNPCAQYLVAVEDGVLAGYLGWWNTPEGAVIVRVAVDPRGRKGGVGRLLVNYAAECACSQGCEMMALEVRAANEGARAFYERMGFQETALRENYYDDPVDDAVVMVRPLNP